jgi:hypothetical protein
VLPWTCCETRELWRASEMLLVYRICSCEPLPSAYLLFVQYFRHWQDLIANEPEFGCDLRRGRFREARQDQF